LAGHPLLKRLCPDGVTGWVDAGSGGADNMDELARAEGWHRGAVRPAVHIERARSWPQCWQLTNKPLPYPFIGQGIAKRGISMLPNQRGLKLSLMPTMAFLEFQLSVFESASKPRCARDPTLFVMISNIPGWLKAPPAGTATTADIIVIEDGAAVVRHIYEAFVADECVHTITKDLH
jgi:hypothetical protein